MTEDQATKEEAAAAKITLLRDEEIDLLVKRKVHEVVERQVVHMLMRSLDHIIYDYIGAKINIDTPAVFLNRIKLDRDYENLMTFFRRLLILAISDEDIFVKNIPIDQLYGNETLKILRKLLR
jgi:hypothetical protein|tara:strand:+ start:5417 stop:5785 length:369 start_codon:yes stop_codon:yes gene_type:complete